ncbi:hypothetical protein PMAYCL1PPCAC_11844, partial [Pristionchus mayeri]
PLLCHKTMRWSSLFSLISLALASNETFPYDDENYFAESSEGPRIVKHSHFAQKFRLGFKLLLICEAEGTPRPTIVWYKNGAEIAPYRNVHIREGHLSSSTLRSALDIDPTTLADKAVYGCLASNSKGFHLKSMRCEYSF